jgi:hypothetical protein
MTTSTIRGARLFSISILCKVTSSALAHDFSVSQISFCLQLGNASLNLRKKIVTGVTGTKGVMMPFVRKRYVAKSSSLQHHVFGTLVRIQGQYPCAKYCREKHYGYQGFHHFLIRPFLVGVVQTKTAS